MHSDEPDEIICTLFAEQTNTPTSVPSLSAQGPGFSTCYKYALELCIMRHFSRYVPYLTVRSRGSAAKSNEDALCGTPDRLTIYLTLSQRGLLGCCAWVLGPDRRFRSRDVVGGVVAQPDGAGALRRMPMPQRIAAAPSLQEALSRRQRAQRLSTMALLAMKNRTLMSTTILRTAGAKTRRVTASLAMRVMSMAR